MFAAPPSFKPKCSLVCPTNCIAAGTRSGWPRASTASSDSFLEGPSFDRAGNLYCTDIPYGRIFRVSPDGEWDLLAEYDGEPNGLKIHKDGRIFIADHRNGPAGLRPATRQGHAVPGPRALEGFKGVNDLMFAATATSTSPTRARPACTIPTGRVYRLRADGDSTCCWQRPEPQRPGAVDGRERSCTSRSRARNQSGACRCWPTASVDQGRRLHPALGRPGGPDGLAVDEAGSLTIAHAGLRHRVVLQPPRRAAVSHQVLRRPRHHQPRLRRRRPQDALHHRIVIGPDPDGESAGRRRRAVFASIHLDFLQGGKAQRLPPDDPAPLNAISADNATLIRPTPLIARPPVRNRRTARLPLDRRCTCAPAGPLRSGVPPGPCRISTFREDLPMKKLITVLFAACMAMSMAGAFAADT